MPSTAKLNQALWTQGFLKPVGSQELEFQGLVTLVLWCDRQHSQALLISLDSEVCAQRSGGRNGTASLPSRDGWLPRCYIWGSFAQAGLKTAGRVELWGRLALLRGLPGLTRLYFSSANCKMEVCGI